MGKNTVSLNDVARRAGVSIGTASRVLNGNPRVSASASSAVQAAILELGYQPDSVARSMRKKDGEGRGGLWSGNIGLVLAGMGSSMLRVPLIIDLVDALQREAAQHGFHLMVAGQPREGTLPQMLIDRKVEGMIMFGELSRKQCRQIVEVMPLVGIGNDFEAAGVSSVNVDNRGAILNAVRSLRQAGKRRIAFVNKEAEQPDFIRRFQAYQEAVREFDLPELSIVMPKNESGSLKQAEQIPPDMEPLISALFDVPTPPDALLVANDWQAIGVYRALEKRHLRPGADVAIIGFDNDVRVCDALNPRLSSIQYPAEEIGSFAFRLLLAALKNSDRSAISTTLLPGKLIERESFCSGSISAPDFQALI